MHWPIQYSWNPRTYGTCINVSNLQIRKLTLRAVEQNLTISHLVIIGVRAKLSGHPLYSPKPSSGCLLYSDSYENVGISSGNINFHFYNLKIFSKRIWRSLIRQKHSRNTQQSELLSTFPVPGTALGTQQKTREAWSLVSGSSTDRDVRTKKVQGILGEAEG